MEPTNLFQSCLINSVRNNQTKNQYSLVSIVLGGLFVQSWRIFKRSIKHQCIIFYRRENYTTSYLYLICQKTKSQQPLKSSLLGLKQSINNINQRCQKQQQQFTVMILFWNEKQTLELNKPQLQLLFKTNTYNGNFKTYISYNKQQQEIFVEDTKQFKIFRHIISDYLNTFGKRYQTNTYKDMIRTTTSNFQIDTLLNTINALIYNQIMEDSSYTQVQMNCWTRFYQRNDRQNRNRYQNLGIDRNDIVFIGSSHILMIDLVFLTNIQQYISQISYQHQLDQIIKQCQKHYQQGKVKVCLITNDLINKKLIYATSINTVRSFQN